MNNIKDAILNTISGYNKIIISPDMDGFMSATLLNRYNGSKVVGTYDKNLLCLADGIDPKECLFVDVDMNTSDYVSIGNHMRLLSDGAAEKSFNPNQYYKVDKYYEKFPYATVFLISFATEVPTSLDDKIRMSFSDSTLRNMEKYGNNMRNWSNRIRHDAVSYVIWNTEEIQNADDEIRKKYPRQEFASKRFGKDRYIETLNNAFISEGIVHDPLVDGKKYLSDKVGINTVKRSMSDIISYAEIFTGEYSVTYNEEVKWV